MTSYQIDTNILSALENWFIHGLPPGNFCKYLIENDLENAKEVAHPLISVENHFLLVETHLPPSCRTMAWEGYKYASIRIREQLQREIKELLFLHKIKYASAGKFNNLAEIWINGYTEKLIRDCLAK